MLSILAKPHHSSVRSSRATPLAVILVALAVVACSNSTPPPPPAPNVSSTSPLNAATGVPLNTKPSAVFDQVMAPLDTTNFTLKQGTTAVAGAVALSTDGATATFTPSTALAAGQSYTATIAAGTKSAAGGALAADQSWSFSTVAAGTPPTVVSTSPANAATGVVLNAKVSATFDRAMTPLTATNFTLKQGTTAVAGTVSTSADGKTATFAPAANLAPSVVFTATIAAGATSTAGGALAADRVWTFTTGTTADTTPPVVSTTNPLKDATGVALNTTVAATFSKAIDAATLTTTTFTLKQGTTPVPGSVSSGPNTKATFTPTSALSASIVYTASLSNGVKDLVGNPLTAYSWNFTTGTGLAKGPAPVLLGSSGNYVVLAQTGISTVPTSAVTGDIGVSPIDSTAITQFGLTLAGSYATSTQVVGKVYAPDYAAPTPSNLTTAVGDMQTAYTDAANRITPDFNELYTGNLGGQTLVPGLYKWTTAVSIPSNVTISGGPNDTWIFQTTGDLTEAGAMNVTLAGGALAKNIWWQVAGKVSIGAGAHFEGVVLSKTDVTLLTSASMNGRILSQTAVALQKATLTQPAP